MPTGLRMLAFFGFVGVTAFGLWSRDDISDGRWLALLGIGWGLLVVALRPRLPRSLHRFNRTVIRTALVMAAIFAIVSVQLVRIQIVQSDATVNRSARAPDGEVIANPRIVSQDLRVKRGRVFDRDGTVLADTVPDGDFWRRVYPEPESAYVVGYYSPLLYGPAGLEATYNEELTGQAGNNPFLRLERNLLHRPQEGVDLHLTLDAGLQRFAHVLLDGRPGAVVLVEIETGAVLTLASNPTFDPNRLFTAYPAERDGAVAYWESLTANPSSPLVERAVAGRYTPGSTFKTVTAAAIIDAGFAGPDDVYLDDGSLEVDGWVIVERNRPDPSIDHWTLNEGLAWSLNVVFAQVGLQLGVDLMWEYAERFGFGGRIPFDLPVSESQLATEADFLEARPALAETAFGQGQLLVSPLHMALIAATFANDGQMMRPYLVDYLATQDGDVTRRTSPQTWRSPVSAETARTMHDMMVHAVERGYAQGAMIDGLVVGGKTGTAETGVGEPHAWFIGFAGNPEPRYAIAVVLEEGGAGLAGSLTIAREMLAAAMSRPGS